MAHILIPATEALSKLFTAVPDDVKLAGASYDAATNTLTLNITGKGLPDFGEVMPERYTYHKTETVNWMCSGTKFVPKA